MQAKIASSPAENVFFFMAANLQAPARHPQGAYLPT
jgi:hypothetical protein